MRGLGDFQRRQMSKGDPRVREVFSHLRQMLDLVEDIVNHPHPHVEPPQPASPPPPAPPPAVEPKNQPEPLLVSIKEARRLIGIGTTQVYKLINDGRLETVLIGGRRMVRYGSLRQLAQVRSAPPKDCQRGLSI